jgi:ABC-2 type transport system permease protein
MGAARRLAWVEVKLLWREPLTVVFTLLFPLITLLVLAEVFGNAREADPVTGEVFYRGVGPVDYYVPAYVALAVAAVGLISLPVHLAAYRERGVLRRLRASGVPAAMLMAAEVAVALLVALAGAVVIALAGAVVYGTGAPARPLAALAGFLLVTLTFAAVGLLLGAVLPTARAAQAAGLPLFLVMMMVCGAGPPPEALTGPLAALARGLPLTYAVRVVQDPWLGLPTGWGALAASAAFLVGCAALGLRLFRWE